MQTQNNSNGYTVAISPKLRERRSGYAHYVFITDDSGIHAALEQIKDKLKGGRTNFLSLVYSITVPVSHILFRAELESLERRFLSQLLTYYVYSNRNVPDSAGQGQQKLEIIINSNTCEYLNFLVLGREDHVQGVTESLRFLGIPSGQIQSQII